MNRLLVAAMAWCLAAVLALPWAAAASAGSAAAPEPASVASAASAESAGGARYAVTADILNVRAEPSLTAPVIGKLRQGAVVERLGEAGVWYQVRLGGLTGWAHSDYLAPADSESGAQPGDSADSRPEATDGEGSAAGRMNGDSGAADESGAAGPDADSGARPDDGGLTEIAPSGPKAIGKGIRFVRERRDVETGSADEADRTGFVLGDAVRVRSGPGLDFGIEGRLNRGDRVTVTGSEGEWYSIVTDSGLAGWIASAYVGFRAEEGPAEGALRGRTIVLDPGHGGNDSGTIGTTYGTWEKTLNLSTAVHLKRELELRGAAVVMTRATDEERPSLKERVAIAEQSGGDAFVSIHYNSAAAQASGILTFYYSDAKDKPLAAAIERRLAEGGIGLESNGLSFGNFHVVRENSLPAVLLELGFLTNPRDEELARSESYQIAAARAIALGLEDYFASVGERS